MTATSEVALEDHKSVTYSDYDITYGNEDVSNPDSREMVTFANDTTGNDDQTEAGLSVLIEKSSQSLQAMKQDLLGKVLQLTTYD